MDAGASRISQAAKHGKHGSQTEIGKEVADVKKCLELQVGKAGEVKTEYGGFEIEVSEPVYFPWYDCLATLLRYGYEVWVAMKKDKMVIFAKPTAD